MRCAIIDSQTKEILNVVEYAEMPLGKVPGFPDSCIAVSNERVDTTWSWDGVKLIEPVSSWIPPKRYLLPKSLILDRLYAAGKLTDAKIALDNDLYTRERWYAADKSAIYNDTPEALALLKAIGADVSVILGRVG